MPGYLQSHQISPSPSQNHCLPLFHVLQGLKTLPYGDWDCAVNKQCIISGWAVVSWLGLGLGWCMADRALCERDENWHFVHGMYLRRHPPNHLWWPLALVFLPLWSA